MNSPTTLYRKYRPQRFADLLGQVAIRTTLTAELVHKKIAHAYLFVGPRGVGKTTTARILAKALNCSSPHGAEPDNSCSSCIAINTGRSLDLIEIDAASHTQVDHVRENILPAARTAPAYGSYKVFIVDEVHMLSISAFSALLKILEEPPPHVVFILATTQPQRVPETIISRCQRFDFRRISPADIITRLTSIARAEGVHAQRSVLERVAFAAGGSFRDSESIFGQLIGIGEKRITDDLADLVLPRSDLNTVFDLAEIVLGRRTLEGLEVVQRLVDDGVHLGFFVRECIETFRWLLLMKLGIVTPQLPLSAQQLTRARTIISRGGASQFQGMLETFIRRDYEARFTTIPQLPLELAIVELTSDERNDHSTFLERSNAESIPTPRIKDSSAAPTTHESTASIDVPWDKVLEQIRTTNPSVALLLKSATPRAMINGIVTLTFLHSFHQEKVLEHRVRSIVEQALSTVFQQTVRIRAEVTPRETSHPEAQSGVRKSSDVWQQALTTFGGKVISSESDGG